MTGMTIELSEYVIDAIADAVVKKMQEPNAGHWIEDEYEMEVRCSECGEENDECSNYCPNCGAKMESEGMA